jgi:hypothetical protein
MSKSAFKIAGAVFCVLGVAAAILHYVVEGQIFTSWMTFAIAAVLLVIGVTLWEKGKDRPTQSGPRDY